MRRGLETEKYVLGDFDYEEYLRSLPDDTIKYIPPPKTSEEDWLNGA